MYITKKFLKFNPRKCTSISFNKGVIEDRQFMLGQEFIKTSFHPFNILANLKDSWVYQLDLSYCFM